MVLKFSSKFTVQFDVMEKGRVEEFVTTIKATFPKGQKMFLLNFLCQKLNQLLLEL